MGEVLLYQIRRGPDTGYLGRDPTVGRERGAPPPAEPHHWVAGRSHIHEQTGCAAAGGELTLAPLGDFASLLAVLAADREGQRAQTLLGDFLAALEAVAVGVLLEADE